LILCYRLFYRVILITLFWIPCQCYMKTRMEWYACTGSLQWYGSIYEEIKKYGVCPRGNISRVHLDLRLRVSCLRRLCRLLPLISPRDKIKESSPLRWVVLALQRNVGRRKSKYRLMLRSYPTIRRMRNSKRIWQPTWKDSLHKRRSGLSHFFATIIIWVK
jgi:hypothetical protein